MYKFELGEVMTAPKDVGGVRIKASLHQREIFCEDMNGTMARIGYCGDKPGMPINLIRRFTPEFAEGVKAFVEKELDGPVKSVHQPPVPAERSDAELQEEDE